jgi:arylsulfatase A-like enzyme
MEDGGRGVPRAHRRTFIERAVKAGKPFFAWHQPEPDAHLHPSEAGVAPPRHADISSEFDIYGSGLMEHDQHVGRLLKLLDDLKIADNTIVVYTTDNGAMAARGGPTAAPRRSAARRPPPGKAAFVCRCWCVGPASIPKGKVSNGIQTFEDLFTTLASAAGVPDVAERAEGLARGPHRRRRQPGALDHRRTVPAQRRSSTTTRASSPRCGSVRGSRTSRSRDGFFDHLKPSALLFNLRMDPYERHGGQKADDMAMRLGVAWGGQVYDLIGDRRAR